MSRGEGQSLITKTRAGGAEKDVSFVVADRTKYRRYAASIISSIVSPEARSVTIKLVPRSTSS